MLQISMTKEQLISLTDRQLNFFACSDSVGLFVDAALTRLERCFQAITNKYYHNSSGEYFSPFHSAQYAQYLYFISREAILKENKEVAEKVYYLNKMLNNIDWFYEVELPDIFFVDHPLGTVLGRAKYSNRFAVFQGCTVGNNHGKYPTIGKNVMMHPSSMICGDCKIGENVEIATNTVIKDEDIPDNSIVFGQSPNLTIKIRSFTEMRNRLNQFKYEDEL